MAILYLLQGLAHDTDNWDVVTQYLPEEIQVEHIDALAIGFEGDIFSLEKAAKDLNNCINTNEPAIICGLSFGSVIATKHAIYILKIIIFICILEDKSSLQRLSRRQ